MGWLLTGRNTSPVSMDIVNAAGQIVGSFTMRTGEHIAVIDHARKAAWITSEQDDVPVFRLAPLGPRLR